MIRVDFLLTEEQSKFINSLPGTTSEHIRRAIDYYKFLVEVQAQTSPSKTLKKGGDKHGSTSARS